MDRNNKTIQLAKKAADAWRSTDTYHQAAQIIDMLISALEGDPTLTPPNEPLTLEQLREMDGDPVWFENMSGGRWCIVYADYHCLVGKMFGVTFEEAERTGRVYRRPPEGEA